MAICGKRFRKISERTVGFCLTLLSQRLLPCTNQFGDTVKNTKMASYNWTQGWGDLTLKYQVMDSLAHCNIKADIKATTSLIDSQKTHCVALIFQYQKVYRKDRMMK